MSRNDNRTIDVSDGADQSRHRTMRGRSRRYSITLFLLSALLCVVSAEVAARAFWSLRYGIPFFDPGRILYALYPELMKVDQERPTRGDEFYDVLLLGGSVLNPGWGQVAQHLREELSYQGYRNVRVFNLATPSHTSRDSWLKYAALDDARFDLVVVYDGINDTRANNAPPEIFREDYSHFSWYEIADNMASYHRQTSFALFYTLHHVAIRIRHILAKDRYVPTDRPREDWIHFGQDPRSALSFKRNLSAILDLAKRRDDRVMLMTFATYLPQDYSLKAFEEKRLAYGLHLTPVEIWGAPEQVLAAVAVQNEVIRSLAVQHEDVLFVDQANLMAGVSRYYNDVCHFTVIGSLKFVENMLQGVVSKPR